MNDLMTSEQSLPPQHTAVSMMSNSQQATVQASMVLARHNPRNENQCHLKAMQSCMRMGVAKSAQYAFPRGGKMVKGPSIHMAKELIRCWGNSESGIVELSRTGNESVMMAFAHDLENNVRETRVFTVAHRRKAGDEYKILDDDRDIYEMTANVGARRLRACILSILPADLIEDASEQCNKTLKGDTEVPLQDRIKKVLTAFSSFGVTEELIVARLGHNLDSTDENEFVDLQVIYKSIKDGVSQSDHWFKKTQAKTVDFDPPTDTPPVKKKRASRKKKEPETVVDVEPKSETPAPAPEPEPPAPVKEPEPAKEPEKQPVTLPDAKADPTLDDKLAEKLKALVGDYDDNLNMVEAYLNNLGLLDDDHPKLFTAPPEVKSKVLNGWQFLLDSLSNSSRGASK